MKIRIYYEDTDVGGVVYFANYLKFCERARSEIFFQKNLSPHTQEAFFIVKNIEADYIKPAVFGDEIEVKTTLLEQKKASVKLLQEIFKDNQKLFSSKVTLAYVKNLKPSKIPNEYIELFKEYSND